MDNNGSGDGNGREVVRAGGWAGGWAGVGGKGRKLYLNKNKKCQKKKKEKENQESAQGQ